MSIRNDTNQTNSIETLAKAVLRLEEQFNNMSQIIEKDKANDRKAVFFFVRLSSSITLNTYSIVKFNEAVINVGNHFNTGDGIFVAPVTGIYQFTWTIGTYSSKVVETELRINNVVKAASHINLNSGAGNIPATKIALCEVKEGYHVWIQTTGSFTENYLYKPNSAANEFTGMLVHY